MTLSGAARALLILGALVGGAAGLALALGLRLDQLPPWMITVGMYKLAFIAAGGLFVAGALVGRAARRTGAPPEHEGDPSARQPAVGPGPWKAGASSTRQADRVDRDPSP